MGADDAGRRRRAVLLGAGHAHLETLRQSGRFTRRGHELVLVAPGPFWYSGLATGMLGGTYPPDLDRVDVAALVARGGGRFIRGRATGIDVAARRVHLEDGPSLRYDALSLNLGSEVPVADVPGLAEHGIAVKPIENLWRLRRELEERLPSATSGRPLRLVVIGGGATACEVAANARRRADDLDGAAEVTVLARGERLHEHVARRAAEGLLRSLRRRGVRVELGAAVERIEPGCALLADGRRFPFDLLVPAIGLVPSPLVRATGLPTDGAGALLVDESLRSVADPAVLGGGDCVAWPGRSLAKVGVYAVREAPILCHNLLATLEGRPPRRFRPQRRFLLILNLGDGTGLASWGPLHWRGRLAFWLKDRIDRRFLARYRATPAPGCDERPGNPPVGRDRSPGP
jgi:NADH dehydrogenase FAD-containing subunit